MMLGAALHMLLKRDHFIGVLKILVDIISPCDFLLIHFDHFLLHALEVVRDVEAIDDCVLMGRYEFGECVDGLEGIFDAEVVDEAKEEVDVAIVRELTPALVENYHD